MHTPSDLPEIIAHRGNAAEFPENTLQGLESAVSLGLKYVEFDVQLTSDSVPVLFHDADLARVSKRPECVHDLTWSVLAESPVGETDAPGREHTGQRVDQDFRDAEPVGDKAGMLRRRAAIAEVFAPADRRGPCACPVAAEPYDSEGHNSAAVRRHRPVWRRR